jgi:hypothetical protein
MLDILNIVLPTFIVILIGYLLGKKTGLNVNSLVEVSFWVGLPALAFTSMLDKDIVLMDAGKVWASSIMIMLGCGVTGFIVFKALRQQHSGLYLPITFMNTVNIPFPIIYLVYGSEGLFAATLFYIPNVLIVYSLGIYIASKKPWRASLKEVLKVPSLYAAVLGLILNLCRVTVPDIIVRPLDFIGMMAIPLVLLTLGCTLASVKISSLPTTLLASFIRIGVGLALGFLAVAVFDLEGILRSVVILDSAMPAAVNTALLAVKYRNEADLVSSVVLVTTIASLVVIPFLLNTLT